MEPEDLELLIDFVAREERYLRLSETSFKEKELEEGRKRIKKVVVEVKKEIGNYEEIRKDEPKKEKILIKVYPKVKNLTTKRGLKKVIDKYEIFDKIFERPPKSKVEDNDPHKFDRFYIPKTHEYR